jgi:hypothetical protein
MSLLCLAEARKLQDLGLGWERDLGRDILGRVISFVYLVIILHECAATSLSLLGETGGLFVRLCLFLLVYRFAYLLHIREKE